MSKPKEKRPKCWACGRVLAWRDFERGVAVVRMTGDVEEPEHRDDCEGVPLHVLRARGTTK